MSVIIEQKDQTTYHEVKRQGDLNHGIVTQCGEYDNATACRCV